MDYFLQLGINAKAASRTLAAGDSMAKVQQCVKQLAAELPSHSAAILQANAVDVEQALAGGLSAALADRLRLDEKSIAAIAAGLADLAGLQQPQGRILASWQRPNGLRIEKLSVAIGVICMIYESRPNVTLEAACLGLLSGNAMILRAGKEARHTNLALVAILQSLLQRCSIHPHAVQYVEDNQHGGIVKLCELPQYIDLMIPRGGKKLIELVSQHARMPVIKHYDGICHAYGHKDCDVAMLVNIVLNAKTSKPGVCNALEKVLLDRAVLDQVLPSLLPALHAAGVETRLCSTCLQAAAALGIELPLKQAQQQDLSCEYLDLVIAIWAVEDLGEAIEHINTYGSHHSDTIVTADDAAAAEFLQLVDSACVYHNASTRFSDGYEFGFGAEIGISTDRLHARGPMALAELNTYKYLIHGSGQVRG